MDLTAWLRTLGLEQYEPAFRENKVTADLLPSLTAEDLKELGVLLVGDRRRLLTAIAALQAGPAAEIAAEEARSAAKSEAERRQVTVMFCVLVGSTELGSRLDPEDLRELIGRYHGCVAETVARFDGFVAKYMGDGVLAYFGYPHAHEDDAEQAVRAGLALIDAVDTMQAPQPLQVRIGIATGLVVVGDLIGAGSAQEQAIVGETPNLAARLQALAEPNAIVIAETTRRQIGGLFELHDLGPQSLKGFAAQQRAWRVLSENRALGRFEALRSGATPLIGRDEETELLLRRWAQAKTGRGRVALISGEPGVGKSRLAEVLAERIATEPHIRLRYFCSPHHRDSALHPIIAQMERAADFTHSDSVSNKLTKLQAVLATTAPPNEDVALIAELHSLPSAGLAPPLDVTPQRKKEKTFEALLRQVEGLSRQQPVLMMFEDIHWIDPSSRELLDRTIEQIATWPLLLVATFRPEFLPPWTGQPHVAILTLTRLDRRDTAAMVANIAANAALPDDIVQEIAERTDGVPLFVEELTNAVLESGAHAALSSAPHPALSVPATLHASLMARLDRLGPAAKIVAQTGAAIGREFGYELLASVADFPEPQLREALDRLTHASLLFARGIPPQSTYIFKHALVQDAAYGTLLRQRRQQLHARIAATLEQRFPEIVAAQPGLLAQHCAEAGLAEKAVDYSLIAGQQALARSALVEAAAQLRKGLDVLAGVPDGPWRRQQELELQRALGPVLAATKGYGAADVGETLARARALAEQIDRPEHLVPLIHVQWQFHLIRAELKRALSLAEQLEKVGVAQNDVAVQLLGRRAHGVTRYHLGEFIAARVLLELCVGLSNPAHRAVGAGLSEDPNATMLAQLAVTLAHLGYVDQASSRLNEALSEARRLRHPHTLANVLGYATSMQSLTRSPELQRHAEEFLALSTEHGLSYWSAWAMSARGRSSTALGQPHEGLALLRQGLVAFRATGAVIGTPRMLVWLAESHAVLGGLADGLDCLAEAAQIIEATKERVHEAEVRRLRGDLLRATGDRSGAERSYRQALAVAQRQSAKIWELRAATSLARLWRQEGNRTEARNLLAPIYNWFIEGFDGPDLIEAKALLDGLQVV
jgi:predicted ATPase/class 3 adenylate cyclase